jgi:hypothetical protein
MNVRVQTSYLAVRPLAEGQRVHRTVQCAPDVLADFDDEGRLIGIERIGGVVDYYAAVAVLVAVVLGGTHARPGDPGSGMLPVIPQEDR